MWVKWTAGIDTIRDGSGKFLVLCKYICTELCEENGEVLVCYSIFLVFFSSKCCEPFTSIFLFKLFKLSCYFSSNLMKINIMDFKVFWFLVIFLGFLLMILQIFTGKIYLNIVFFVDHQSLCFVYSWEKKRNYATHSCELKTWLKKWLKIFHLIGIDLYSFLVHLHWQIFTETSFSFKSNMKLNRVSFSVPNYKLF